MPSVTTSVGCREPQFQQPRCKPAGRPTEPRRAIAERLPEAVAAAALEFCISALAVNPHRVGKPQFGPLTGCRGARRGTYRIVYQIDEKGVVHVLDIDHRSEIYRRPQR
jgi:mRNA interferase RelE/StbE